MEKNLYEILGVSQNATEEEIKKAYRKKAREYHPDMHQNESEEELKKYEKLFQEINNAHEILSNKSKRREYDYELSQKERKSSSSSTQHQESHSERTNKSTKTSYDYKTAQESYNQSQTNTSYEYNGEPREEKSTSTTYESVKKQFKQAWDEIRKEEQKDPFIKRHTKANKVFHEEFKKKKNTLISDICYGLANGTLHVFFETFYQVRKLGKIKEDSFPKFVIRNRKLLATLVAGAIIISVAGDKTEEPIRPEIIDKDPSISMGDDEILSDVITVYRNYEIQKGDTLTKLAEDANTTVDEIVIKNGIENPSYIQEGQNITIPYRIENEDLYHCTDAVKVSSYTSITDIAEEYNTTRSSIIALNREAIDDDGNIISNVILVPNFISQQELNNVKEPKTTKVYH